MSIIVRNGKPAWGKLAALILGLSILWLAITGCSQPTQEAVSLQSPMDSFILVPLCRQATNYTCGVAALQSILYYYGDEVRQDILAEELKSDPDIGTNYHYIIAAAQTRGIQVEARQDLAIEELKAALQTKKPVMVAIQAWADDTNGYAGDWDDGHWAVAVGYDSTRIYLMDPSTLGNFTYISIPEFLDRWHDIDSDNVTRLNHFALIFSAAEKPSYNPNTVLPLSFWPGLLEDSQILAG
jgi:ABC-type bacteriocin/lantibiotic exporter with double-glycine peptidase domain